MKLLSDRKSYVGALAGWLFFAGVGSALELPPDVMIARFKGDRAAALSLTFDDALKSQADTAIPILDRYGLKGTFFLLISNVLPEWPYNWDFWKQAGLNGHEIGSHSMTHPLLTPIRDPQLLDYEITESAAIIERKTGIVPLSFAYPESDKNTRIRRLVLDTYLFDRADCRVWGGDDFGTEDGIRQIEQAIKRREWMYVMLHGVGEDSWGSLEVDIFENLVAYLSENEDRVWVDTYTRVATYEHKRNSADIQLREVKPGSFYFRLILPEGERDRPYPSVALTVKIDIEGREPERMAVIRNGDRLSMTPSKCGFYTMVDVLADGTWIKVDWNKP